MKANHVVEKLLAAIAAIALFFACIPAQAADLAGQGVIVSRVGNNLVLRGATGNFNLTVNDATKIEATKGLVGLRSDTMTVDALIPGLSVKIEATSVGGQAIAKTIKFSADDLKRASEIQAALAVPQQEAAALREQVKAQQQVIAVQDQQITASQQQIAANQQQIALNQQQMAAAQAEIDKRFSELADYDVKSESTILFEVNSANLSSQAKMDLQAVAAKAKSFKGYLIQVAGYADSDGSANLNQNLSDRRAESVVNYLRQEGDVGISRVLAPVAMSTAKAVASNETAQGRAENRRVVVKILVNRGIAQ